MDNKIENTVKSDAKPCRKQHRFHWLIHSKIHHCYRYTRKKNGKKIIGFEHSMGRNMVGFMNIPQHTMKKEPVNEVRYNFHPGEPDKYPKNEEERINHNKIYLLK